MDNYPLGAANDPRAPYNEPLEKNKDFEFELHMKGKVHSPHYTEDDLEEKLKNTREALENIGNKLVDEGYRIDVDFDVKDSFSEVW